jgi:hypothetical protein
MAEGNPSFGTDGIVATTLQKYSKRLVDQVFKQTILLHLLGGEGRTPESQTGRSIVQELLYGDQAAVGSFSDVDVFAAPSRGGITAAEFAHRSFYGSIIFSGEEMDKNSGPEAAVSLLQGRITQVERTMAKTLNADLHSDGTGNGGKQMDGLVALFDQDNTYAGIDRNDALNAWWRASTTAVGGVLTEAAMRSKYNDIVDGSEKASNILTTQDGYEAYEGLLQGDIRHMDTKLGDAGFDNLMFKTTPMVFDRDVPAGVMYFLNMAHIKLVSLNGAWFRVSDWLVPTNQDAKYKNIILRGNLVTSNASLQGQLTGITNA